MSPTLFDLPSAPVARNSVDPAMPKDGDVLLILGRDGSTRIVSIGIDSEVIMRKVEAGEELSETEQAELDVSAKAFALLLAAQNPMIMTILEDIAQNPDVIDPAKLAQVGRLS